MKISTRVELGIVALADIAAHSENGSTVSTSDIAQRQGISQKYLEQIIVSLRQGGFVVGQKGSRGGYVLSRSPEKIFLSQVLDALDNTILADTYEFSDQGDDIRSWVNGCLWEKLNDYMRSLTGQMSLADLIKEYKANQSQGEALMYYI